MAQRELKFDIEALNNMKNKLADVVADLENCTDEVVNSLEKLKGDWHTAAGQQFMQNVDTDWTKEVEKYVRIVRGVEALLNEAAVQYQRVEEEVENLKFY